MHINDIIYDLSLHEETYVESKVMGKITIFRVPGGWLYNFSTVNMPSVFVPFNNDMMKKAEPLSEHDQEMINEGIQRSDRGTRRGI